MIYHSVTPSPPLAEFVEWFWQCADDPTHPRERILPSGTIELVINLQENEIRIYDPQHPDTCKNFSGAVVSGPYSRGFLIDPQQHASIVGVHFKPGGAFPFLVVPADKVTDTHIDLENIWGRTAPELRDQLSAAATAGERFSLLEGALTSRLRHSPDRRRPVSIAIEMFAETRGTSKSKRRGLSHWPQPEAIHPGFCSRSRSDAQALLPRATISERPRSGSAYRGSKLGPCRNRLWLFRPIAPDSRFPSLFGAQSV